MSRTADIRPARASDVGAIRAIARTAYAQYIAAIGREPAPMVADFAALIAKGHVHVAVVDSAVAGFIVFYPQGDAMHLENVAVAQSGMGLGKRLIAFVEAEASRHALTKVTLYTNIAMTENLTLYPHLGYTQTGERVEDGFHRVYFEKKLS